MPPRNEAAAEEKRRREEEKKAFKAAQELDSLKRCRIAVSPGSSRIPKTVSSSAWIAYR